jgi:predicted translin family RNA/ssDNA-binding protein
MKINSNVSNIINFLNRNFKVKERPILQLKEIKKKKMAMITSINIENTENNIKEKKIMEKGKKLRSTTANISSKLQNNLKENIPTKIKEEFQKK